MASTRAADGRDGPGRGLSSLLRKFPADAQGEEDGSQVAYEALREQWKARTEGERPGVLQDPAPQLVVEHVAGPCSRVPSLAPAVLGGGGDAVDAAALTLPLCPGLVVPGEAGGGGEEARGAAAAGARGSDEADDHAVDVDSRVGLQASHVRFFRRGELLSLDDSPDQLGLEDDHIIEVQVARGSRGGGGG